MAKVAQNVLANMAGTFWGTAIGLLAVPLYLRFIGVEGYGLIGFYVVLSSLLSVLDAGFSAAAGRALARFDETDAESKRAIREMLHVLERLFLAGALAIGSMVIVMAPVIANRWLNPGELAGASTVAAVRLMGAVLVLQFPLALYNGCLLGLQRHALLNGINSAAATVRALGAILVLWLVSPTVEAFFWWQMAVTCANVLAARSTVWRLMPPSPGPLRFRLDQIKPLGSYALGMGAISMLGLVVTQLDKVVLSLLLPLHQFGYYVLAWTLSSVTYRLSGPVFAAILPRLTQLAAKGEEASAGSIFQKSGQLMAVLVTPFSLFLAAFAEEIVALWTRDPEAARAIRWVVAMLAVGTMLSGMIQVPLAHLMAQARLRPLLVINLGGLLVSVPLLVVLIDRAGINGAAASWALLNVGLCFAMVAATWRTIGKEALSRWLVSSVAVPIGACAAFLLPAKVLVVTLVPSSPVQLIMVLLAIGLACQVLLVAALPIPRARAAQVLGPLTGRRRGR
jgi:O-antigen/teichoic acid export membrane protein